MASLRLALKMSMEDSNSTPNQSNSSKGDILNNDDKKGNISKRKRSESTDDSSSNNTVGIKIRDSDDSEKSKNTTIISATTKRRSASDVNLPTPRSPRSDIIRSIEGKRVITPVVASVTKIHGNTKKINIESAFKDNNSKSSSTFSPRENVKVKSDSKNIKIDSKETQKEISVVELITPRVKSPPPTITITSTITGKILPNKFNNDDEGGDGDGDGGNDDDNDDENEDNDDFINNDKIKEENENENIVYVNEINEFAAISDSPTNMKIDDTNKDDDANKGDDVKKRRKRRSNNLLIDDNNIQILDDNTDGPRYQSHRAAAMVAKSKLKEPLARERGPNKVKEEEENKTEIIEKQKNKVEKVNLHHNAKIEKSINTNKLIESVVIPSDVALAAEAKWVECELCAKWRSLPSHVDIDALPEQWYCSMNLWDDNHNTCDAPEDNADYGITIAASDVSLIVHEIPSIIENIDKNKLMKSEIDKNIRQGNNKGLSGRRGYNKNNTNIDLQSKEDNDDDDNSNSNNNEVEYKKRKYVKHQRPIVDIAPIIDQVNWVQCNKCTKWRKVPGSIDVELLPDIWYCNLNTWEPLMAKCSVKEDTTEPTIVSSQLFTGKVINEDDYEKSNIANNRPKRAASSTNISQQQQPQTIVTSNNQAHNNQRNSKEIASGQSDNKVIKKVTQWVQCERRNCKKWRKVPVSIDFESLPEKWFCEMNIWNLDRASCDGPEETDSETEQESAHTGRSQLLLANSKGPKDLSYRRIIFGTDGRIRPCYNEKNKNGFGLFSFTELHRQNDMGDYIEPTRRVNYWWSSAFDEKGSDFISAKMRHPGANENKKEKEEVEKENIVLNINNKNIGDINDSCTSSILLDAAKRFDNYNTNNINEPYLSWPRHKSKVLKMPLLQNKISTYDRLNYECSIVRSCLLNSMSDSLALLQLINVISTSNFINPIEEFCRVHMNLSSIKSAIRRLELEGEAQITRNSNDDIIITILGPIIKSNDPLQMMSDGSVWSYTGIPLKMRKAVASINEIRSYKLKEEEEDHELNSMNIQEEKDVVVGGGVAAATDDDDDDDDDDNKNFNFDDKNDVEIIEKENKDNNFMISSNLNTISDDSNNYSDHDVMQIYSNDVLIEEVVVKKEDEGNYYENTTFIENINNNNNAENNYKCNYNINIFSMKFDYNEKNIINKDASGDDDKNKDDIIFDVEIIKENISNIIDTKENLE